MDRDNVLIPGVSGQARLGYCASGREGYSWKKQLVAGAQTSIRVLGNYGGGVKFRRFVVAIGRRLEQVSGLKAQVMMSKDLLEPADRDLMGYMRDTYRGRFFFCVIEAKTFILKRQISNIHEKMVIADTAFVTGSAGIAEHFTVEGDAAGYVSLEGASMMARATGLRGTREAELVGDGEMSAHLATRFDQIWAWGGGADVTYDEPTSSPLTGRVMQTYDVKLHGGVRGDARWRDRLLELIAESGEIWIANMSFADAEIARALGSKKVHLITNGDGDGSVMAQKVVGTGSRLNYRHLSDESEVYEWDQPGGIIHEKKFVFRKGEDEWITYMGTANLNPCSAQCDTELMMEVSGWSMALKALAHFEDDKQLSVRIPAQRWATFNTLGRRVFDSVVSGLLN